MAFRFTDTRFEPFQPTRRPNVDFDFGASTAMDRNRMLPQQEEDPYAGLMNLQDGPAKKAYKDFLAEPDPRKEDFKPTKMNRLAAILSGASDGMRRGAGAGFETAQGILNRPYDEAMGERVRRAKQLEAGYKVEDGDFKDKVLAAKTALDSKKFDATEARNERRDALNEKNVNSQIAARDAEMKTRGFTSGVDIKGERFYQRIGADGKTPETIYTGIKVNQSPEERMRDQKGIINYTSGVTEGRQGRIFDRQNAVTNRQQNERQDRTIDAARDRQLTGIWAGQQTQQRGFDFTRGQRDSNPNNQYSLQALALHNVKMKMENEGLRDQFTEDGLPTSPEAEKALEAEIIRLRQSSGSGNTPGLLDPRISGMSPDQ